MYLLFDIGGTHTRSAVSKDGKTFDKEPLVVDTPKKWDEAKKVLTDICRKYGKAERVCVAIAGEFDEGHNRLISWANQPDWVGKPLKKFFEEVTGASVLIVNDAAAAAIGEAKMGAGKGYQIVAYLTVGTGVGGARVINGALDENTQGFEPGRQIIDVQTGETLEQLVAGSGFAARFGPDFLKTAPREEWIKADRVLAIGIHNTVDYWSPDVVVVGGGMVLKPNGILLDIVREELRSLNSLDAVPPVVPAALGDESGLWGALFLLK